ncbi:MAG: type II secretion system protein GspJ [Fimbriiglobus sp.]
MRIRSSTLRPAYTLLEILLASLVAVILLAALYGALELTLVRMDASRNAIIANDLSRAIFSRMSADITCILGPLPPKSGGDGTTGGAAATPMTTTPSSTSTPETTTTTPAATNPEDSAATPAETMSDIPFGAGVVGTDKQATFFVSRTPNSLTDLDLINNTEVTVPSDMRRVSYYLASDGQGLARQERPWVTAEGIWNSSEPDRNDELSEVIAPEVKDITFEYYDGGTWQSTWDGTATDIDGVSLVGPPRAIRITLVLEFQGKQGPVQKNVVQTIAIRAAVGNYTPPMPTEPETTTPTTGGM